MSAVTPCDVPEDSLLARYGGEADYRDAFYRDVEGAVDLSEFIERFYRSGAFLPERMLLHTITRRASSTDARAIARAEADEFGVWRVVERTDLSSSSEAIGRKNAEALFESKDTGTASWFKVEPAIGQTTRLTFGSWVGNLDQSGWKALQGAHVWYSKALLGAV